MAVFSWPDARGSRGLEAVRLQDEGPAASVASQLPFLAEVDPLLSLEAKQRMPASANPPCWPGGVAQHERVRGHVPRHHRAHAHHREFTQRDARPNRGVRADGDAAGKSRRERLIGRVGGLEPRQLEVSSPGKTIVGEDGVGGNHAKVFNRYRSANVYACVDLHEASNDDVVSNVGL